MFRIGTTPAPIPPSQLELLRQAEPSTIGHYRDQGFAHGLRQIVGPAFVGSALTVRLPDLDATALHGAVDLLEPGHVLVVDMGGRTDRASVGSIITCVARHRGAVGVVVDGMVTDHADLVANQLPVHARGISARTTRVVGVEGDINVPVTIGGAVVSPGQAVLAGPDGVLFLDVEQALLEAERAVATQQWEVEFRERITSGASLAEASGAAAHLARAASV